MKLIALLLLATFIGCAAAPVAAQAPVVPSLVTPSKALQIRDAEAPAPSVSPAIPPPPPASKPANRSECRPNWTAKKYKSFDIVQHEIRQRYGEVRILRVALCGEGATAYFQIIILSGQGQVSRVRITAAN